MKRMDEMLLRKDAFSEIVMGNTAVVRAMIESGIQVVTSYPGSPTPEIATAIGSIAPEKRPFYFEFSTNEKVALEVAYGAAVNGHASAVFFKSVGLNVASDTFVQLSMMNIIGGLVIVLGDDPGANSSQNEQDNRHYARMSYTPLFEPANPTEAYHFFNEAVRISKKKQMPVIVRMTTHVCHAKERVSFSSFALRNPDRTPRFDPGNGPYVPIASAVFPLKRIALKRLREFRDYAESSPSHVQVKNGNPKRGIITAGLPFLSLMDVLKAAKEKPDILKLGIVHPLPKGLISDFLRTHSEVRVLEELDDFLEQEIKALAFSEGIEVNIIGKLNDEEWIGEYTPDKVYDILKQTWNHLLPERQIPEALPEIPDRPAQMCPGCGHRSAFHAIKQALTDNDITVADIGCHTLGFLPPYKMGKLLMCMGASNGMGAGLSLFNNTRKVVTFIGDSTFFHAGLPGIVNAVFNRHNFTMILMENGTTAMTGHQDHAASGKNFNEPTTAVPVRKVLEGLGVEHIFEVDTYQQKKLTRMVREAIAIDGFSVVIAKHPCMLKFMRAQRKKPGYVARRVSIDQDTCTRSHECVEKFACPTFTRKEDGRVRVNPDLCIGDGSCMQTCPAGAILSPESETEK